MARTDYEYHQGRSFVARATTVAFADFDRDGRLDAIVTNLRPAAGLNQEYYLTLLRGHGDGVFDPTPALYLAGLEATAVEAADLNGDNWPDAVTANGFGNSVSVHLNAGDGTLLPRVDYPAGQQPRSIKIADINSDMRPDLACLNCISNDVSVFLGRGDGTFEPEVRVAVGSVTPRGLLNLNFACPGPFLDSGDLDGNSSIDFAVPARSVIKLLLNDGSGGLTISQTQLAVPPPYHAYATVISDLDRDGRLDVAATLVSETEPPRAAVFLNLGDGQFGPAALYDATSNNFCPTCAEASHSLAAGDMDGDGYPELAVGHHIGSAVAILRNLQDGTFGPRELHQVFDSAWYVRLTDLNGDGRADLVALAASIRAYLHVVLAGEGGVLQGYEMFPPSGANESRHCLAVADFDGEGDPDLVTGLRNGSFPGQVRVIRNDAGTLVDLPPIALAAAGQAAANAVAAADLNGDGRPDIVVADTISGSGSTVPGKIWVILNQGGMSFAAPVAYPMQGAFPAEVAIADFNQDRAPDLAVWLSEPNPQSSQTLVERRVLVMLNNGQGSFSSGQLCTIDSAPWFPIGGIAAADVTGDGLVDIVASSGPRGIAAKVVVLRNLGAAAFAAPIEHAAAPQAQAIGLADLNRDGTLDVVVAHNHNFETPLLNTDPYLTILYNNGAGALTTRTEYSDQNFPSVGSLAVAAVAARGQPRLVVPAINGQLRVFLEGEVPLRSGESAASRSNFELGVAIVDLDRDGRLDVVHVGSTQGYTVVQRNRSCNFPCYANCDSSAVEPVLNVADFICFQTRFAAGDPYANCDGSTAPPVLNVADFICYIGQFAAGCP